MQVPVASSDLAFCTLLVHIVLAILGGILALTGPYTRSGISRVQSNVFIHLQGSLKSFKVLLSKLQGIFQRLATTGFSVTDGHNELGYTVSAGGNFPG
jgi:hypothetical protein